MKIVKIASTYLGFALRVFATMLLILEVAYGLAIAAIVFWAAYDGSMLRGGLAVIFAFIFTTLMSIGVALFVSVIRTTRKAVKEAAIGQQVFEGIFDLAMDSSYPQTPPAVAASLHLTIDEVEAKLRSAANQMLYDDVDSNAATALVNLLARGIEKVTIWATIRVIVGSCSTDGQPIDWLLLRERFIDVIDDLVDDFLAKWSRTVVLSSISCAAGLTLLTALILRRYF